MASSKHMQDHSLVTDRTTTHGAAVNAAVASDARPNEEGNDAIDAVSPRQARRVRWRKGNSLLDREALPSPWCCRPAAKLCRPEVDSAAPGRFPARPRPRTTESSSACDEIASCGSAS